MYTQQNTTPTPNKRRGRFSKSRLKVCDVLWRDTISPFTVDRSERQMQLQEIRGQISLPQDFRHTFTVQRAGDQRLRSNTPPGSPAIPRLRAIARK